MALAVRFFLFALVFLVAPLQVQSKVRSTGPSPQESRPSSSAEELAEFLRNLARSNEEDKKYRSLYGKEIIEAKRNGIFGGGTGYKLTNQVVQLVDIFVATQRSTEYVPVTFEFRGDLPETDFLKNMGFERLHLEELPYWSDIQTKLDNWYESQPNLIYLLRLALSDMEWTYANWEINKTYGLVTPAGEIDPDDLVRIAVYSPLLGARVDLNTWRVMDDLSKQGLIFHEGLRHLQIKYGVPISHELLQKVSAAFALNDPNLQPGIMSTITAEISSELGDGLLRQAEISRQKNRLWYWSDDAYHVSLALGAEDYDTPLKMIEIESLFRQYYRDYRSHDQHTEEAISGLSFANRLSARTKLLLGGSIEMRAQLPEHLKMESLRLAYGALQSHLQNQWDQIQSYVNIYTRLHLLRERIPRHLREKYSSDYMSSGEMDQVIAEDGPCQKGLSYFFTAPPDEIVQACIE